MSGEQSRETAEILVVDDNKLNRLKLSRSLEQEGLQVTLAENGREALEIMRGQPFDVVLLDIIMPEMDGYEVLETMKADTDLRNIPVIVISALDEIDSAVRCIEMGAEDYLPKPFNPVFLRARLDASLRKKKLRDLERAYLAQEVTMRQNEKLTTLGRLSAGMAHELNNPAAASVRGASQLQGSVASLQQAFFRFNELDLTAEQLQHLAALEQEIRAGLDNPPRLDGLARSDMEYEVEEWLDEWGVTDGWSFAPTLVSMGCDEGRLNQLAGQFEGRVLTAVLVWLKETYTTYHLIKEIGEGTSRISEIVNALKTYSYMDQAPMQSVDIHQGLDDTLTLLHSKVTAGVRICREYGDGLPRIEAYGSELNQVWTNIIDNALYAVGDSGEIKLKTYQDGRWLVIEISDDGPGITADIQSQVFDPFFTTKPPGSGSGLGLNISHNIITQKHEGTITVESRPGFTCFQVKLPI